jgi:hypothetical protein
LRADPVGVAESPMVDANGQHPKEPKICPVFDELLETSVVKEN